MVDVLIVRDLVVERGGRWRRPGLRVVDGASFTLAEGECYGVLGEGGSGKSSLGLALLGLLPPLAGTVALAGEVLADLPARRARRGRVGLQLLPQQAGTTLDPRLPLRSILAEGLRLRGVKDRAQQLTLMDEMLAAVGLDPGIGKLWPQALDANQRLRCSLARVLLLQPRVLILDEPTAGLDLGTAANLLRLLHGLRRRFGFAMLLLSADPGVVRRSCDHVAVMYLGRLVERGPTADVFAAPRHPYTQALLSAVPRLGAPPGPPELRGDPPSLAEKPPGCRFHPRCMAADMSCLEHEPAEQPVAEEHLVSCHHWQRWG